MGEAALNMGINTIVDLDLTDLFFSLYRQEDYFNINEYNPEKFKEHIIRSEIKEEIEFDDEEQALKQFYLTYSSPAFGFSTEKLRNHK